MRVHTRSDLDRLRAEGLSVLHPPRLRICVGMATCGLATGAAAVYDALRDEAAARGLDLMLVATGCIGYCQQEPLVDVRVPDQGRVLYARMTPERARALVAALAGGELPAEGALAVIPEDQTQVPQTLEVLSDSPQSVNRLKLPASRSCSLPTKASEVLVGKLLGSRGRPLQHEHRNQDRNVDQYGDRTLVGQLAQLSIPEQHPDGRG